MIKLKSWENSQFITICPCSLSNWMTIISVRLRFCNWTRCSWRPHYGRQSYSNGTDGPHAYMAAWWFVISLFLCLEQGLIWDCHHLRFCRKYN